MAGRYVVFNNGVSCPIIGFGTWMKTSVAESVKIAIDVGYRMFDCACNYGNEKEVGEALREKIREGVVKREDLFITTKVGLAFNRPDLIEVSIRNSLKNLGLEYLDLYLIHWPQTYKEGHDPDTLGDPSASIPGTVDYVDNWKAIETLVDKGLTRSIGVSNFNKRQLTRVLEAARIKPAALQIEVHPYLNQVKLIDFCQSQDIRVIAFSPLGSPDRPWAKPSDPVLFQDKRLQPIADKHQKSLVQVLLRYAIDRGLVVIPKSSIREQIEENYNVFDFQLTAEDLTYIRSLECNFRFCTIGE
ncbi:unnamed protein product [Danaus chrysippus]|uniref:(African queen) hypothetical protein n=1 Tax=Danaus chrysippus TaxID=151541 RepID=A0A8J2W6C6_9NEOP|nr:unnamed protein product [Danaus chrysippus]